MLSPVKVYSSGKFLKISLGKLSNKFEYVNVIFWMESKTEPLWREFASKTEPPQPQILLNICGRTLKNQSSSNKVKKQRRIQAPLFNSEHLLSKPIAQLVGGSVNLCVQLSVKNGSFDQLQCGHQVFLRSNFHCYFAFG